MRPARLVAVTGTGTEVGKTWVTAGLVRAAVARGLRVAVRKPAQSFAGDAERTDAEVLARASGESPHEVCPAARWYAVAMAPPMAAEALDLPPPTLADLQREVSSGWPLRGVDVGFVEGAGGVASPLAVDGDSARLARRLGADKVVVVAPAELGVINALRLSRDRLRPLAAVAYLNRFDPGDDLHVRTLEWLIRRDGFAVVTDIEALAGIILNGLQVRR